MKNLGLTHHFKLLRYSALFGKWAIIKYANFYLLKNNIIEVYLQSECYIAAYLAHD